tara:strand:+ start:61 stop:852 length:792 start_codon:yes stop_codon:yes gene_type:complete
MSNINKSLSFYEFCKNIVVEAGMLIEDSKNTKFKIIRKSKRELVTEIDLQVQNFIKKKLAFICDCPIFFEEERNISHSKLPEECFIIDPIDATHNFIAGLPFYNISIGYIKNNEIIFGIIYFPYSNETYHAYKDKGAFKNNEKIKVSSNVSLGDGIIAYDNQFHLNDDIMKNYQKLVSAAFTTRILGSASRDACFVAEGVVDARVWNSTKMYDIIAGAIIVKEAGGRVSDFNGNCIDMMDSKKIIMSNNGVHKELINLFNECD